MFINVTFSRYNTEETGSFGDRISGVTVDSSQAELQESITQFVAANQDLTASMNRKKAEQFTEELKELDEIRSKAYRCLKLAALSAIEREEPEVVEAATQVNNIIQRHPSGIDRMGYNKKLVHLTSLIQELATITTVIEQAGMTTQFEYLNKSEDNWSLLYQEKVKASKGPKLKTLFQAKKDLKEAFEFIQKHIEVLYSKNEEVLKPLIAQYNEIIAETNTLAKARQTRKDNNAPAPDAGIIIDDRPVFTPG